MAKQLVGVSKFQVPGGQATPAPPVGTSLGRYGINLGQFVQQFNDLMPTVKGLLQVAEKILHEIARPFRLDHTEVVISASIGISAFPNDVRTPPHCLRTPIPPCTAPRKTAAAITINPNSLTISTVSSGNNTPRKDMKDKNRMRMTTAVTMGTRTSMSRNTTSDMA